MTLLNPSTEPPISKRMGCLKGFLILLGVSMVLNVLVHLSDTTPQQPVISEQEKRQNMRKMLDPSIGTTLSAREHLQRAKTLLSHLNVNAYEEADVLIQLISEHGAEARLDPRVKAQADALMKRMTGKALEVLKMKV